MSNRRYANGIYEVKQTKYPPNRPFKVQLISDPDSYHSHVHTLKEAIDLANYAKHEEIPRKAKSDYLVSLYRVAFRPRYRNKIDKLIRTKEDPNPYAQSDSSPSLCSARNHLHAGFHR